MNASEQAISYHDLSRELICKNDFNLAHLSELQTLFEKINFPREGEIIINGSHIQTMDTAGAWLLSQWVDQLKANHIQIKLEHFSKSHLTLYEMVDKKNASYIEENIVPKKSTLKKMGQNTLSRLDELSDYLHFIGELAVELLRIIFIPSRWRLGNLVGVIDKNGYQALPIIALLSFMIGVVLTYQMGLQLRNYGANIYIVDLLGLSVLREFGPLLTAIMVAGRTGSAFTAQLGIMKINQEIDALDTMGVTPQELLIIPRILGLFIALPLLTIWADIFGVFGGMVMANNMLGLSWYDFLHRFPKVIPLKALLIGIGKAPIFALIISSIGCYEGMKVKSNANSVGLNTTRSVVLGIFFIIVADAIFSIIFSKLKL